MSAPVVLITGALTGIGRATVLAFARKGARIVVSGRHADAGQALVVDLRDARQPTPNLSRRMCAARTTYAI